MIKLDVPDPFAPKKEESKKYTIELDVPDPFAGQAQEDQQSGISGLFSTPVGGGMDDVGTLARKKLNQPSVLSQFGRGLVHGTLGIAESLGTGLKYLGGRLGSEKLQQLGEETRSYWEKKAEPFAPTPDIEGSVLENPGLLKDPSWWAYNVGDIIPSLAASLIPGAGSYKAIKIGGSAFKWSPELLERLARLGAAIAGGAAGGGLEGANTYEEVLKRGGTEEQAARAGEMMSLASGALNAISLERMLRPGKWFSLKRFLLTGSTEALTEYLEEPAEVAIKKSFLSPEQFTTEEALDQLKQGLNVVGPAFITGGLGGLGGGAARGGKAPAAEPTPRKTSQSLRSLLEDPDADPADRQKAVAELGVLLNDKSQDQELVRQWIASAMQAIRQRQPIILDEAIYQALTGQGRAFSPSGEKAKGELAQPEAVTTSAESAPEVPVMPSGPVERDDEFESKKNVRTLVDILIENGNLLKYPKKFIRPQYDVAALARDHELTYELAREIREQVRERLINNEIGKAKIVFGRIEALEKKAKDTSKEIKKLLAIKNNLLTLGVSPNDVRAILERRGRNDRQEEGTIPGVVGGRQEEPGGLQDLGAGQGTLETGGILQTTKEEPEVVEPPSLSPETGGAMIYGPDGQKWELPSVVDGKLLLPKSAPEYRLEGEEKRFWDEYTPATIIDRWADVAAYMGAVEKEYSSVIKRLQAELIGIKEDRSTKAKSRKQDITNRIQAIKAALKSLSSHYEDQALAEQAKIEKVARQMIGDAGIASEHADDILEQFFYEISDTQPYIERNYNKPMRQILHEVIADFLARGRDGEPSEKPNQGIERREALEESKETVEATAEKGQAETLTEPEPLRGRQGEESRQGEKPHKVAETSSERGQTGDRGGAIAATEPGKTVEAAPGKEQAEEAPRQPVPSLSEDEAEQLFDEVQALLRKLPAQFGKAKEEGRLSEKQLRALKRIEEIDRIFPRNSDLWDYIYKKQLAKRQADIDRARLELAEKQWEAFKSYPFEIGDRVRLVMPPAILGGQPEVYEGVIEQSRRNGKIYVRTLRGNFDFFKNPWRHAVDHGLDEKAAKELVQEFNKEDFEDADALLAAARTIGRASKNIEGSGFVFEFGQTTKDSPLYHDLLSLFGKTDTHLLMANGIRIKKKKAPQAETSAAPATTLKSEEVESKVSPGAFMDKLVLGNEATVTTGKMANIPIQYALVDVEELITSHTDELADNPEFPQELQPRNRSRLASEEQVGKIVRMLNPDLLGENPLAQAGAPIVNKRGVVLSGNARAIGLRRVIRGYPRQREKYHEWLKANRERFGFGGDDVIRDNTVLVRILKNDIDQERFAQEANAPTVSVMSASEQALADARKITPALMGVFAPSDSGDLLAASNREFVRGFLREVVDPAETNALLTKDGELSQAGVLRVRNALLALAYEDIALLERMAESPDDNVRNITNGMIAALTKIVKVKQGIKDGLLYPLDLTTDIVAAMRKLSDLRSAGLTYEDYLKQGDMFDNLTQEAKTVLGLFSQYSRSPKKIGALLECYADTVLAAPRPNKEQGSLFNDLGENIVPTKSEVLEWTKKKMEAIYGPAKEAAQFDLFRWEPTGSSQETGRAIQKVQEQGEVGEIARKEPKEEESSGVTSLEAAHNTKRREAVGEKTLETSLKEPKIRDKGKAAEEVPHEETGKIYSEESIPQPSLGNAPGMDVGELPQEGGEIVSGREAQRVSGQESGHGHHSLGSAKPERNTGRSGAGDRAEQHNMSAERPGPNEGRTAGTPAGGVGGGNLGVGGAGLPAHRGRNTRIGPGDVLYRTGDARIEANIKAIEVLKKLEEEDRPPSDEERKALLQFSGWGAAAQVVFHLDYVRYLERVSDRIPPNIFYGKEADAYGQWASKYGRKLHPKLGGLLTEDEFKSASASSPNAHYTSREVIACIWDIVRRLGFKGGRVLEPSAGIGHFIGLAPDELADQMKWTAIELDSISGRILKALYPEAKVHIQGFETAPIKDNSFDLVVGNFPFGNYGIYDKGRPYSNWSIHNYFFARSLDAVKPGGLVVAVTSHFTMDSIRNGEVRQYLTDRADLIGAIRLPNNAFLRNAGTQVTTDIIILRKKTDGTPSMNNWRLVGEVKTPEGTALVNEYFIEHPQMVLGIHSMAGSMYGGEEEYTLKPKEDEPLEEQLRKAVELLPRNIIADPADTGTHFQIDDSAIAAPEYAKEGTLILHDGKVYLVRNKELISPSFAKSQKKMKQAEAYVRIKEVLKSLYDLMIMEEADEAEISDLQKRLNDLYDDYIKRYGYFHLNSSRFLDECDEFPLALSLEKSHKIPDPKNPKSQLVIFEKAEVFSKRTIYPFVEPKSAATIDDAAVLSLNYRNRIDLTYIAQLLNITEEEAKSQLIDKEIAFENPETGQMESHAEYLSGNVRRKLEIARERGYNKNVQALEKVQPPKKTIDEIYFRLGSEWIPPKAIEDYLLDVMDARVKVRFDSVGVGADTLASWAVSKTNLDPMHKSYTQFGVPPLVNPDGSRVRGLSGLDIVELSLNLKRPEIYNIYEDGDTIRREKNEALTLQAIQKQKEIQASFREYIKEHPFWATEIADIYNREKNCFVVRKYPPTKIDYYPNANREIKLRQHQKDGVERGKQGSTIFADAVGTGKTYLLSTLAMELRRTGMARKPMIVVQGSTLNQFAAQFQRLYPRAKILIVDKKKISGALRRQEMLGKIAAGDWDAIIIAHSTFNGIGVSPQREAGFIREQIEEIREHILALSRGKATNSITVKQLEKALKEKAARLQQLSDMPVRDNAVWFDQLGVDALLVDEAHTYKRGYFFTKLSNIKGIDSGAAKKSFDFLLKCRCVQERTKGRNIYLATGTPVSNTIAEVWTLIRYVRPDLLKEYGVGGFDAFVSLFAETTIDTELTETGEFKQVERLNRYQNGNELMNMWLTAARVILQEDVPGWKDAIPRLKDDQVQKVVIERPPELEKFIEGIRQARKEWDEADGKYKRENRHIPLLLFGMAKKGAIDLRLVDPRNPDIKNSKVNRAVEEIFRRWKDTQSILGTQLVFCDVYQSPDPNARNPRTGKYVNQHLQDVPRFNLYQDIKRKLIEKGIPQDEIAIITDSKYNSDEAKEALFEKVNAGEVRVLIGSTEKLGVGVNVQERLVAIHHLDAPLRPMDFEQRNGRILRPGNRNAEVEILAYAMLNTLDAVAYDRLQKKQRFINQILRGNLPGNAFDDPCDELQFTFEDLMAAATGNPLVKLRFQLENELRELELLAQGHKTKKGRNRENLHEVQNRIAYLERALKDAEEMAEKLGRAFPDQTRILEVDGGRYAGDTKLIKKSLKEVLDKKISKEIDQVMAEAEKAFEEAYKDLKGQLGDKIAWDILWMKVSQLPVFDKPITLPIKINGIELDLMTWPRLPEVAYDPGKRKVDFKKYYTLFSFKAKDPAYEKYLFTDPDYKTIDGLIDRFNRLIDDRDSLANEIRDTIEKQRANEAALKEELQKPFEFEGRLAKVRETYQDVIRQLMAAGIIKSEAGADTSDNAKGNEPRFALRSISEAGVYYSQMAKFLEDKLPASGNPLQWRDLIGNWAKKGKIKSAELQWSGLLEWLNEQKGRITKQDVIDFLKNNQIEILELEKNTKTRIRREEAVYDQYASLGGENYRELLLMLSGPTMKNVQAAIRWLEEWGYETDYLVENLKEHGAPKELYDAAYRYYGYGDRDHQAEFYSQHWEEPNVIAHVRMTDRLDENGNKVLYLEEIQSDWAKELRRREKEGGPPKVTIRKVPFFDSKGEIKRYEYGIRDERKKELIGLEKTEEAAKAWIDNYINRPVPPMPFKEGWLELALKRMLRYAAENGYDRMAWVRGNDIIRRFRPLGSAIAHLRYKQDENGRYTIRLQSASRRGGEIYLKGLDQESVFDKLGSDVAEKVLSGQGRLVEDGERELSGSELYSKGDWARTLYDIAIPSFLKKYCKRWGSSVELVNLRRPTSIWSLALGKKDDYYLVQRLSVPITPAMKESVLKEGQPLFRIGVPGEVTPVRQRVLDAISPILDKMALPVRVSVIDTIGELPQTLQRDVPEGSVPEGVFDPDTDTIYLVASNLTSAEHAQRILAHELFGHLGVRGVLGDRFKPLMNRIFRSYGPEKLKEIADTYGLDLSKESDQRLAAEELIARMAETGEKPGILREIWAAIRAALRRLGFDLEWTDNDLKVLVWKARGFIERANLNPLLGSGAPAMSLAQEFPEKALLARQITDKYVQKNDPDWIAGKNKGDKAAADRFAEKYWRPNKTEQFKEIIGDPFKVVLITMPSTTENNLHPLALAEKLNRDIPGLTVVNGQNFFRPTHEEAMKNIPLAQRMFQPRDYEPYNTSRLRELIKDKKVYLVDDIFTTGGSFKGLVGALNTLGFRVAGAVGYMGDPRIQMDQGVYRRLVDTFAKFNLPFDAEKAKMVLTRREAHDLIHSINTARDDNARRELARRVQDLIDRIGQEEKPTGNLPGLSDQGVTGNAGQSKGHRVSERATQREDIGHEDTEPGTQTNAGPSSLTPSPEEPTIINEEEYPQGSEEEGSPLFALRRRKDLDQSKVRAELDRYEASFRQDQMSVIRDMLRNWGKGTKEQRPDITILGRFFGSPEYTFEKVPALERVLEHSLRRADLRVEKFNQIITDANGRDLHVSLRNLAKDRPEEYRRLAKLIKEADQNRIVHTPATLKGLGFSDQAIDAWKDFRTVMDNGFDMLIADMREMERRAEEYGLSAPQVVILDEQGRPQAVSIKTAIAQMGNMKGWYAPRIRQSGRWQIVARPTKEMKEKGYHPILEFRDFGVEHRAAQLRQQGYMVEVSKSKAVPEDLFAIYGKVMGTEQMINEALQQTMKEVGKKSSFDFSDMGISAVWGESADGKPDLVLDTSQVPQGQLAKIIPILKSMGGRWYAAGKGERKFWHFVGADKRLENRLRRALSRYDNRLLQVEEEFARALAINVANIEKGRGFRSSMIQRGPERGVDVWEGYETDPLRAMTLYASGISAGMAKKECALNMIRAFNGMDISWAEFKAANEDAEYEDYMKFVEARRVSPTEQKNAYHDGLAYIQEVLRNQEFADRVVGLAKGLANMKYLGFRVAAPLVNLTSLVTSVPAAMNGYAGIPLRETAKWLVKGVELFRLYRDPGKWDALPADIQQAFKIIQKKGWAESQYNKEAMAVLKSKIGRGWDRVVDASMWLFGLTEQMNRVSTIMGTFAALRDRGIGVEEALEKAKRASDRAHGIYGPATLPALAWGKGPAAMVAKSIYVFKKFQHTYLQTLYDLGWRQRNWRAATFMMVAPTVLAGAAALPLPWAWEIVMGAIKRLLDVDDPEERFYSFMEDTLGDYIGGIPRQGIARLGGLDLRGSLGMGRIDVPTNLVELLGAPGSVITDLYYAGENILRGDIWRGAEKALPRAGGAIIQSIREAVEGVTTARGAPVFFGSEQIRPDFTESLLRALSFNPAKIQKIKDILRSERLVSAECREMREDIYARYRRFFLLPEEERTKEKLLDLVSDVQYYNNWICDHGLAGIEPLITSDSVRANLRRTMHPSQREIRMEAVR